MPVNVTLQGADYPDVPSVILPKTGGGNANFYHDLKLSLRPDAEKIKTWTYDKKIVADEGKTIPAYSTNQTTLLEWAALSGTYSCDLDNYDYYMTMTGLSIPIYSSSAKGAGRLEYFVNMCAYEFQNTPKNYAKAIVDGTTTNTARVVTIDQVGNYGRAIYWSSSSVLNMASSTNQGVFDVFVVAPAMSAGTITARAPRLCIRGDSNIFNSTYWGYMTDIRYQYVIDLWRAPKNNLNRNGWVMEQLSLHGIDCANSSSHTLT